MSFLHPRLLVDHFLDCYRFYRDVLQLQPHWGDETGTYASFSHTGDDKVALAIFQRQNMAETLGTTAWPLIAAGQDKSMLIFGVTDVDATVLRIKQMGWKIEMEPTNFPDWGFRGAYLRDPDGTLIELSGELSADRWSAGLREANEKWKTDSGAQ